jgi:hypothetical protein
MTSPFPGMDPFLEGYLWPDFHQAFAEAIKEILLRQISPNYVARTNIYTVMDSDLKEDVGILYPDVHVLRQEKPGTSFGHRGGELAVITPASVVLPIFPPVEVKIPFVEIKDRKNNTLITAIEILSPVNKRRPGLAPYRKKRSELHHAGVHLLEIDLLRRGERPFEHLLLPVSDYLVTLTRGDSSKTELWVFGLKDELPIVPVPLKSPDADVPLDLRHAFDIVYERSMYELSIDYTEDPPPPLSEELYLWIKSVVSKNT